MIPEQQLQVTTAASGKGTGMDNRLSSFFGNLICQSAADGALPLLTSAVSDAESGDFYVPGKQGLGATLMQVLVHMLHATHSLFISFFV